MNKNLFGIFALILLLIGVNGEVDVDMGGSESDVDTSNGFSFTVSSGILPILLCALLRRILV